MVGFTIQNVTEGLAIVAPMARSKPQIRRLLALGLLAGAPAIVGAWIGSIAFNASLAAFLFGVAGGAVVEVAEVIWPAMRDSAGRASTSSRSQGSRSASDPHVTSLFT